MRIDAESMVAPRESWNASPARCDCSGALPQQYTFLDMSAVFASTAMQRLLEVVMRISRTNASVLITGETGTGKELIARSVHHFSNRASQPWVDVNCAALPFHLLESELFGYEKGAFSGADGTKQGLFELADGGTLFLDEIGELDLKMQVKLLRVLDGAAYYRLGGTRKVKVDVRIVAATNMDLAAALDQGTFRKDLFHRLDQVRLDVPPLRERPADVLALAAHFLSLDAPHLHFSARAMEALERYPWPGNVRELKNLVIRTACLAETDEIGVHDLPDSMRVRPDGQSASASNMEELEQQAIFRALSQTGGKQERAADLLGISKRTLMRRLKLYRGRDAYGAAHVLAD